MTRYEIPAEAVEYFALRDTVAELLKEAGVKKHSRHAVAEVLLEAGVIDLAAFEIEEEDEEHQLAVGDTAMWNGIRGEVVGLLTSDMVAWRAFGRTTMREVPVEWLIYEEPSAPSLTDLKADNEKLRGELGGEAEKADRIVKAMQARVVDEEDPRCPHRIPDNTQGPGSRCVLAWGHGVDHVTAVGQRWTF